MRRLAVLLLLAAGPAYAQVDPDDTSTDGGLPPTSVHARLAGTTVELTARFAFDVDGPTFDVGIHPVTLPPGAVVTSAVATVNRSSHRLTLDDAEHIENVFSAFTTTVAGSKRAWAVRIAKSSSGGSAGVDLDIAAAARGHVVVELSVEVPGCFYGDARYAQVPASWYSHLDAIRDRVKQDDHLDGTCNVQSDVFPLEWLRFPVRELTTKPFGDARIGTAAGRLALGEDHVARVEIDLSSKLTQVPGDLHTAIVIDGSRSLSADEIETQRAIVASYLQQAPPQSHVQVIAYARHAKALLPSWMPAASSAPRIDREIRALAPRNGSNVDEAIVEAGVWLARATGTRRLIVIDDGRFASRISEIPTAQLAHALPDRTLVHVVDVSWNRSGLVRMDDLMLGELAASTGGIGVAAGMPEDHKLDATMLVHPLGIDRIKVTGSGWHDLQDLGSCPTIDRGDDELLAEGMSCTWWGRGDAVSGPITFEGFLWGQHITRVLRADPSQGRHLARELTTSDSIFDDDMKKRIDRAAFAVNDAWSMLVTWGGTGGYADIEGSGSFGFGRSGSSHDGVGDSIGFASGHVKLDLKKQLAPAVAACHATASKVTIGLETTLQEIVDVTVAVTPYDETIQRCIVEAVWDISLAIPSAPAMANSTTVFDP